ncbi:DNA-binding MarR family transcriptional regulator [Mycolicibacterium sp. BK556]|uniref:MarR family winged helix-turn-helix transcriptional regulator n=1 Tax=unclassified Mycolicibacterium TaxID=2636767 RepID=UPI001620956D|nr:MULTISPECIES: MarR family transcriptional regulator [unclassified Mycolicibacterium]MBB3602126.1 DNA-binding MarR family transcriptional regulator [Mycolicibacterium sp. BK556]MBB3631878.1 DNA-binding MarR family transcriptional regulator [Mycolicibacterium sp. BK607]
MADEMALLVADVYELAGLLRRSGEALAAREGQTQARWQLLSVISDEALTVPQAARRLGVTRQAVQRVANELVSEGLVDLGDNPDHQTSSLLSLTDHGRGVLTRIGKLAAVENRRLLHAVGEDVLRSTHRGVRTLAAALKV